MEDVPQVVANCKILGKLGQGGMGSVYRSVHLTLGRKMAIKILPVEFTRSPEYIARFLREARTIAALHHPNIVLVHDAGEQRGLYYIAMELVDGASLAVITRHCTKLPEVVGLEFMRQAATGLGYAHSQGLVHRDIKPENLLVNREGMLKVVDFGLVLESANQSRLTRTGTFLGTPTFMSPEQCDGDLADGRSDLYSLGATFYCILTGRAPFTATSALGIMYKHKFEPPPPMDPHLSERTTNVIFKLLSKKREERYQSADELVADVTEAIAALPKETDWSLDDILTTVAPPLPEPTAEELAVKPSADTGSETITMRGAPGGRSAGPVKGEFPSAGPVRASSSAAMQPTVTPAQPNVTPSQGSAWDPTVITNRTPPLPGATPAPGPIPGTATPAPVAKPARTGLWLSLAAVVVVALTAGGFFLYQHNRRATLERYVREIEKLREAGDLNSANMQCHLALAGFPDEPRLTGLQDEIKKALKKAHDDEINNVRKTVRTEVKKENALNALKVEAQLAVGKGQFDKALSKLNDALKLNIETDDIQASIRGVKFKKLTSLASAAEESKKWDDALALAKQALEFGSAEEQVHRLEQRVKLEALRTEAGQLLVKNDLLAAADKYEAAADFAFQNQPLKTELLDSALQQRLKHYLGLASDAEKKGAWNNAITSLTKALDLKPDDETLKKRLADARTTLRKETNYDSAMKLGQEAMGARRWSEAAEMYSTALRHKEDSAEAKSLLAEAQNRGLLDRARTLVQSKAWTKAKSLLDGAKNAFEQTTQTDVKGDYARLGKQIQTKLDEIAGKEALAAKAAKEGSFETAISGYKALVDINPSARSRYDNEILTLSLERAFRDRLAEGDRLVEEGQYRKARNSYSQALEKRDDEKAAAIVKRRLVLVAGAEKFAQIEPVVTAKNWSEAKTRLAQLQKEIPADATELTTRVAATLKTVDDTLARIASLERTGGAAETDRKWEDGRQALEQLIKLNPSKGKTYRKHLDDLKAAETAYKDKAARKARYDRQMTEARKRLNDGDEAGALSAARQALADMPGDAAATALVAEAHKRQAAKLAEKALSETHQGVAALLDKGQLDQALTTAQTAARRYPAVAAFGAMSAALTEMRNAKQVVGKASPCLDESARAVQRAQGGADSLRKALESLKGQLAQQEADILERFKARDYAAVQESSRKLSTDTYAQVRATLERVARSLDKLGDDASKSTGTRRFKRVGEMSLEDDAPRKGDPKKAAAYRQAAKEVRDLAAGLR